MKELSFSLERTVVIRARRSTVFRYFTDSARFASWWGAGSSIEPRAGGAVVIRYPGGVVASGNVVEIVDGERVVFTYGYEDANKPIRPGGSLVTVTLRDTAGGTEVELRHDVADAGTRDEHVPGWRFQLSLFANIASGEEHAGAEGRIDAWFGAWQAAGAAAAGAALEPHALPGVEFRDRYASVVGIRDVGEHIHASHVHMPGIVLARRGGLRICQGTAVTEWVARGSGGAVLASGINVFEFAPDGRIASVVGLPD